MTRKSSQSSATKIPFMRTNNQSERTRKNMPNRDAISVRFFVEFGLLERMEVCQ
jgi:predicted Kef-type K+ transport protein